jgi:hypothetical protein
MQETLLDCRLGRNGKSTSVGSWDIIHADTVQVSGRIRYGMADELQVEVMMNDFINIP